MYQTNTDIARILSLPKWPHEAEDSLVSKWSTALQRHGNPPQLRPIQAMVCERVFQLLEAAPTQPYGLFCPIGVGHGKTLISMLLGRLYKAKKPLLIVPPDMLALAKADMLHWSSHYIFPRPHIIAYSKLSSPKASDLLERLAPDLIILDEAHCLRRKNAARTKRMTRYMTKHPQTRVVALSGTLTTRSILDYAHIMEWAIRGLSVLPLTWHLLELWAAVLDVHGIPDEASLNAVLPLLREYGTVTGQGTLQEKIQRSYYKRLRSCPGVVSTVKSSCDATLVLRLHKPPVSETIHNALEHLEKEWVLPDGTEIVDGLTYHRNAMHLSAGFFYEWVWPNGIPDVEYLEARKQWHQTLRHELRYSSREHYDSPALIEKAINEFRCKSDVASSYEVWRQVKERKMPPTRAVWLTEDVPLWALMWRERMKKQDTILWYKSRAMGNALYHGDSVPVYGAGTNPPKKGKPALSIAVHHKGKNLFHWSEQCILEPPTNGAIWEQLLGRTHRQGQQADTVYCDVLLHTKFYKRALKNAKADAKYIENTTGQRQKLNYCREVYI